METKKQSQNTKIYLHTLEDLRDIHFATREPMVQILERLVKQEKEKVLGK